MAEPWLRGPLTGVSPYVAPTLHAYQQVREDLASWTQDLTPDQLWRTFHSLAPVGYHLRHIAGSVDRLTTYLRGELLAEAQLLALQQESEPGTSAAELLNEVEAALANSEAIIRALADEQLTEPRIVGRQQLPTTVIGLVVHLAEHTMRHTGQAITTAKLARQS